MAESKAVWGKIVRPLIILVLLTATALLFFQNCGQFEAASTAKFFGSSAFPPGVNGDPNNPTGANNPSSPATPSFAFKNQWTGLASQSTTPTPRWSHSAVWTGKKMIIWGGSGQPGQYIADQITYHNDGASYDPTNDTWSPISKVNAPSPRAQHTAVWTGTKMIVWGGTIYSPTTKDNVYLNDGGIYDPETDSWSPLSNAGAPSGRIMHVAAWTGAKMLVWGGYDPTTLKVEVPCEAAPCSWRNHLIPLSDGYLYDPTTGSWQAFGKNGAVPARYQSTAAWTGSQLIMAGGVSDAVLSGTYELVQTGPSSYTYGGTLTQAYNISQTVESYDPKTDSWTNLGEANASVGLSQSSVWTGHEMIVFGGYTYPANFTGTVGQASPATYLKACAKFDPKTNQWSQLNTSSSVLERAGTSAVWTGSSAIIWGGRDSSAPKNDGAIFN